MKYKTFGPSNWSVDNRTVIFFITFIIAVSSYFAYDKIPKETFPDIVIPQIIVSTPYPGTSSENIETLVTKPIEKEIKSINGLKKLTSSSVQGYSSVVAEFETSVSIDEALQKVKDAVDRSKQDLPSDLPADPNVFEINLSDLPIMYINISGEYDLKKLKKYANILEDKIEVLPEISKVDQVGALEPEIQVNVDLYKMQAAQISFSDIENAIRAQNINSSAGVVRMGEINRTLNIKQLYRNAEEVGNTIIRNPDGEGIFLRDIAEVIDTSKEQLSYSRLNGKNVITLNVVKRSGENILSASEKIDAIIKEVKKTQFPDNVIVTITGDQSEFTKSDLKELFNTIIIGFILVTLVLMFFMGTTNALFVATAIPLSCAVALLVFPTIGFTMNMIVLFSFLLALGIVVDNAIVVIENTHRIFDNGKVPIKEAAKQAAGEVFQPVFSGTLTTLAPFVPLAFWPGIVGEFMYYLPITLIITLLASLFVAYVINPVFATRFMKATNKNEVKRSRFGKSTTQTLLVFFVIGVVGYGIDRGMGNLVVVLALFYLLVKFFLSKLFVYFQQHFWPKLLNTYERSLRFCLKWSIAIFGLFFVIFVFSFVLFFIRSPKVVFFPQSDPNYIYVYVELPEGTHQDVTNEVVKEVEKKINVTLEKEKPAIKSIITNITRGASAQDGFSQGDYPNKGLVNIAFVKFDQRNGVSTVECMKKIRDALKDTGAKHGASIVVEKDAAGPPTGKAISIEITGHDLDVLYAFSQDVKRILTEEKKIGGIEELGSSFENNKPEITFTVNKQRANLEGVSLSRISGELRTALFGREASNYKFGTGDDDYPITVRLMEKYRDNISVLRNILVTFQDQATGGAVRQIPISAFADIDYGNSYSGINRKNQKRIITLSSNVLVGYNANEVVAEIERELTNMSKPDGISIRMGGEQEEQKETADFLFLAFMICIGLVLLILVTQFNSISKPIIILTEIIFSISGVLIGFSIFKMEMSIVMCGLGIVALAGIIVNNGILILEFIDLSLSKGNSLKDAIVDAGRTRLTPIVLTMTSTILGLIPLAIGLNIDFGSLLSTGDAKLFFGGDNVAFWGPLSWTLIFGLGFGAFISVYLVPVLFLLSKRLKKKVGLDKNK